LLACSKEEVKPDLTPRLGVLELPIAHRTGDPIPEDAARLEITPSELALDGVTVTKLEKGKLLPGDQAGYDLPALKGKLSGKRAIAISVYAAVPYATLARVMHTALSAGTPALSFKVRRPNATKETGFLTIPHNRFVDGPESVGFAEAQLASWDSFANVWDEALRACQVSARADCGYRPEVKAQGGKLELMLRVRGAGLAIRFRQAGAQPDARASADAGSAARVDTRPAKKRKRAELLDGVSRVGTAAQAAANEPATEHVFTLRSDQATVDPSPITGIVRPVCGAVSCPVVFDAEGITMSGQVLGLLGAAFADGGPAPTVAWVLPPKGG
jgi:hypothetical protein